MQSSLSAYYIEFKDFSTTFKQIRKQKFSYFGEITLMKNIKNNIIYQMKEETLYHEKDLAAILEEIVDLLPLNSEDCFFQFIGYSIKKNIGIIPKQQPFWTIYMLYEHFPMDFDKEITRLQKLNKIFEEKILWFILEDALKALSLLDKMGRSFLDYRCNGFFLTENQGLKIFYTNYHKSSIERIQRQEVCFYKSDYFLIFLFF